MKSNTYSKPIAWAIQRHMMAHDWKFHFREETGHFIFIVGISGRARTLHYHLVVSNQGYTVCALYPLGADPQNEQEINTIARFLLRANYDLRQGSFELDVDKGEIRYKIYVPCPDIEPTDTMILESIHCPTAMFEKYGPGIQDILYRGVSDTDALASCEKSTGDLLSLLTELKSHLDKSHNDGPDAHIADDLLQALTELSADPFGSGQEDPLEWVDDNE